MRLRHINSWIFIFHLFYFIKTTQSYTRSIPGQTSCYLRCLRLNMDCNPATQSCVSRQCRANQIRRFGVCVCREGFINRNENCIRQFKGCGEFEGTIGEDQTCRCQNGYVIHRLKKWV